MRTSLMLAAAIFALAGGTAMADTMAKATPKPSPAAMHGSMASNHMHGAMSSNHMMHGSMKSNHMTKSNSMKSNHMMASPKPSSQP